MEKPNFVGKHAKIDEGGEPIMSESDSSYEGRHAAKESDPWGEEYLNTVPDFAGENPDQPEKTVSDVMPESLDSFDSLKNVDFSAESVEELLDQELLSESDIKKVIELIEDSGPHMRIVREILQNSKSAEEFMDQIDSYNRRMLNSSEEILSDTRSKEPNELAKYQANYQEDMDGDTRHSRALLEELYNTASRDATIDMGERRYCLRHIEEMMDDATEVRMLVMGKPIEPKPSSSPSTSEPSPFL